jgi:RNA polymerase sigma-70 factor (ECF subfamily)
VALQADIEVRLVQQAQAGDLCAFEQLVVSHQRFVYNLALRTVNQPEEAEDLAQEALVRAWQGLPRFRGQSSFRTWLYRITLNLCYNRLPRLRRELADDVLVESDEGEPGMTGALAGNLAGMPGGMPGGLPGAAPGDNPARAIEVGERRRFLHQQIDLLPQGQRLMVLMRYQQEMSYEEIAQVMDLPLGTVKTGLFRAHTRLRQALSGYEEVAL